jgi:hypothetical protein
MIDGLWQYLRQSLREVLRGEAHLGGELGDEFRAQHLVQLLRGHGLVRTGAHPGAYRRAKALLFELRDDALNTPVALDQSTDHGGHFGTAKCAIQRTQSTALKGRRFESIEDQNAWLAHWEERWAAPRIHGRKKRQVLQMFAEENPALKPLPAERFGS